MLVLTWNWRFWTVTVPIKFVRVSNEWYNKSSVRVRTHEVSLHIMCSYIIHGSALYHNETSGVENTTINLVIHTSVHDDNLYYIASNEVIFALLFIWNRWHCCWILLRVVVMSLAVISRRNRRANMSWSLFCCVPTKPHSQQVTCPEKAYDRWEVILCVSRVRSFRTISKKIVSSTFYLMWITLL